MSMPPIKKIVVWLIVIFLLYAICTNPHDAANIVLAVWNFVSTAVKNLFIFMNELLKKI